MPPRVTIGIVSCNRFHYLKALIESARECIRYDNLEWIVADNASIEPGLRAYVDSLDFVKHRIYTDKRQPSQEHTRAMNRIIEESSGKYILLMPEDMQFIVRGSWLDAFVELLETDDKIGTICFDAQRRVTLDAYFNKGRGSLFSRWFGGAGKIYQTADGSVFTSYGSKKPGISGAGILSLTAKEKWRALGPFKATGKQTVADSSGGGEAEMLERYRKMGFRWERVLAQMPVAADIITDMQGTKARIRGNKRFGKYFPPPDGRFYYKIWDMDEMRSKLSDPAASFEDVVVPLGFELPYDAQGHLLKNPHFSADADFEWIHPSVEGVEIIEDISPATG